MKITVVEKLGAWVSYGKDEIKIHQELAQKVPTELDQDFRVVLENACKTYYAMVEDEKQKGNKPNAMALKKKSVEMIQNWLKAKNLIDQDVKQRVVVPREPRIPGDNEVPRIVQRQEYLVDINADQDEISEMFDNFDSENLSDEQVEQQETESLEVDLGDDLFEGIDLLDGLDDF